MSHRIPPKRLRPTPGRTPGVLLLAVFLFGCHEPVDYTVYRAESVLLSERGPQDPESLRFAVIGDSGTGESEQYEVGEQMITARERFPFDFVLMLGDNMYGDEDPADFTAKFEIPYSGLLSEGVEFYASLGNHDEPEIQVAYEPFNMDGRRYYTFSPRNGVRFFALDSNYMDPDQIAWLEDALASSQSEWKILFFHHPLYSSGGRHGSDLLLREALEPLILEHGVDVVFAGHEHFYERLEPQNGVQYFIVGSSAKLRRGDIEDEGFTAAGFDQDRAFLVAEIDGDELRFETVSRTGETVDSGVIRRVEVASSVASEPVVVE